MLFTFKKLLSFNSQKTAEKTPLTELTSRGKYRQLPWLLGRSFAVE